MPPFFWLTPITRSRHTSPANLCTAPILCREDAKQQTIHGRTFWSINSTRFGRNEVISKAKEEKHYLGSTVMCQDYDHQEGGGHRIAPQPRGPAKEELPPNFQLRTLPELFSDLTERTSAYAEDLGARKQANSQEALKITAQVFGVVLCITELSINQETRCNNLNRMSKAGLPKPQA
ncbi:Hypothetical predicted protein [Lynx pardinus]|uniref:Uncharacterized protein n=1 Tax=Lynx pardinus TaxID=191816 RepID=A0A485MBK0_LYNPA|nr:Hypothetical predicted protein [Lynx pardinus]